ncbi:hypothetical protein [Dechloromonas sp. CZR5]|uniref:hypothetical protein n=1 Tax=Dechloromonas sp. CZR5 TaxID=2608630 RepID=UPI00123CCB2A|nr:hypothetical protein [Dechloromonas sp. CZR5]
MGEKFFLDKQDFILTLQRQFFLMLAGCLENSVGGWLAIVLEQQSEIVNESKSHFNLEVCIRLTFRIPARKGRLAAASSLPSGLAGSRCSPLPVAVFKRSPGPDQGTGTVEKNGYKSSHKDNVKNRALA